MNILYIEDNVNDSKLVERYVRTTAHQIHIVQRLEDAREVLHQVDLILMDILIDAERRGLDYLQALRRQRVTCPVLAVTALVLPDAMETYRQAGFDDVLKKPFEIEQLAALIRRYEA
jgi:two-component system, OmpR family, response regulator